MEPFLRLRCGRGVCLMLEQRRPRCRHRDVLSAVIILLWRKKERRKWPFRSAKPGPNVKLGVSGRLSKTKLEVQVEFLAAWGFGAMFTNTET